MKQYQIDVHPDKMRAHRVTLPDVYEAVRKSNIDVGAKVIEKNGIEFFIRGVGFVKSVEDLENIVIRQEKGTPIQVRNVATVTSGPEFRRGALDKAGVEAVGGVVAMRYGENPLEVIDRVKEKIKQIEPGLPQKTLADGRVSKVSIVPFYDRTDIIHETIDTLRRRCPRRRIAGGLVIFIFLLHLRSTLQSSSRCRSRRDLLHPDVFCGHRREHHVARRPRHRHRRRGRHGHHHDGEHLPPRRR